MKHLRIMGWLWVLTGLYWSLLALWNLPRDRPWGFGDAIATLESCAWALIGFGTFACGLAVRLRWRWFRAVVWIVGSAWVISVAYLLWIGQNLFAGLTLMVQLFISLYSMSVLALVRNEPKQTNHSAAFKTRTTQSNQLPEQ